MKDYPSNGTEQERPDTACFFPQEIHSLSWGNFLLPKAADDKVKIPRLGILP